MLNDTQTSNAHWNGEKHCWNKYIIDTSVSPGHEKTLEGLKVTGSKAVSLVKNKKSSI